MRKLVSVLSNDNTTVDKLLEPFGINQKVVNKKQLISKQHIIFEEYMKINDILRKYRRYLKRYDISNELKEELKKSIRELESILDVGDEAIYKYAIKCYPKELITSNGGILDIYNPYAQWISYNKNSEYTKIIAIKNPKKENEIIYVNSARYSEIMWDFMKYRAIQTDATILLDGIWRDEKDKYTIKVNRNKKNEVSLECYDSMNEVINICGDPVVNIVEVFI